MEVVSPNGYILSASNQGNDNSKDSNFDKTSHKSENITLTSGEENLTIDGGLYQPANLGDRV